jgi:hypothetical protein
MNWLLNSGEQQQFRRKGEFGRSKSDPRAQVEEEASWTLSTTLLVAVSISPIV